MATKVDSRIELVVALLPPAPQTMTFLAWKAAIVEQGLPTALIQTVRRGGQVEFIYDSSIAPPNDHLVRRA